MKDRAYAKINLALDVFNIREDGYHDLKSIMVPVDFYDVLDISVGDIDEFICNKSYLKMDDSNSVFKMINLVRNKFNINDKFVVSLNKHIPSQAGLGGGTSDGASALRILNKMYSLRASDDDIKELCLGVGADVLFNYYNKPAVVEGIGDIVTPFNIKNDYYVLLVKPRFGVSTKDAYEKLDMNICDHPNIDVLKDALINGEDIRGLLSNSLEQPSLLLNKEIAVIKNKLNNLNADNVLMSGSGSTVFALSENKNQIDELYKCLRNDSYFLRYTKIRKC